jgi:hypothetical protein
VTALPPRRRAAIGAALAVAFAATGLLFLLRPAAVLAWFDRFAPGPTLPAGPERPFWLVLAGAYMYLVTLLAWQIHRHPTDATYPRLLAHAKWGSAALSLAACVLVAPRPIFVANALVDGALGAVALFLWRACARAPAPPA